jgi:hypothetical protein
MLCSISQYMQMKKANLFSSSSLINQEDEERNKLKGVVIPHRHGVRTVGKLNQHF